LETLLKPFVVGPLDEIKLWLGELFADFEFDLAPHEITQIEPLTDDLIAQRIHSWRDVASRAERFVLGPIAKKLSQANREAAEWNSEKLASLRQLAYGASHEINNPLANIATRAQLLIAGEKDDSRRKQLATIYRQAMRAHEMICDMMLFAHPPQPSFEPIELNRVVREAYQEFDTLARQSGGSIALEIADDVIELQADPGQIITMLNAIVQNAFESRAGSHVSIRCGLPDRQYAIILISDNGPGVSPETARHMFDPFYSGREAGRGLGFGLSKAWTIARLHGGDIRVQASDANGTIMRIELPIQHRS
jgi:signal transduction histidine kinase